MGIALTSSLTKHKKDEVENWEKQEVKKLRLSYFVQAL